MNSKSFAIGFSNFLMLPGQIVPPGLHYRMNLKTGYKEAKLLERENEKTSLVSVGENKDDESGVRNEHTDVELARQRLEAALKNIPANKFDDNTEEKWKEVSKKFRSYEELKKELKDIELNMKSEMDILNALVKEISSDDLKTEEKLKILEDIEYFCHNIDNALHFVSIGGLEKILVPSLNDSNAEIVMRSIRTLAVILQNNIEAKNYVIEKTNIANYLINILSKSINSDLQSSAIFAYGSLLRNNQKAIRGFNGQVPSEIFEKGVTILIDSIIANSATSLKVSVKALTLISDLLNEVSSEDQNNVVKFVASLKVCTQLEKYFANKRLSIIADIDFSQKVVSSMNNLKQIWCNKIWSDSPEYRHDLLVTLNNFKSQLKTADEDSKFFFEEIVEQLESLTTFLYDNLKISKDYLSEKYKQNVNDEL
jgi:nucleotide exchange factor SIL1